VARTLTAWPFRFLDGFERDSGEKHGGLVRAHDAAVLDWSRRTNAHPLAVELIEASATFPGFFLYYPTRKQQPALTARITTLRLVG